MKNIAILVDGKIKFVADWPEETKSFDEQQNLFVHSTKIPNCKLYNHCQQFRKLPKSQQACLCDTKIEQALANAIQFKDQREIKFAIWDDDENNPPPCKDFEDWEMEPLKPYEIPSEIKITFKEIITIPPILKDTIFIKSTIKQFAFIVRQPIAQKPLADQYLNKIKEVAQLGKRTLSVGAAVTAILALIKEYEKESNRNH